MQIFSNAEKQQVKKWLQAAFNAASSYNASRLSEKKLFEPLSLFDHFVRTHGDAPHTSKQEQEIIESSYPDHPAEMPVTVDGFLDLASAFYARLKNASSNVHMKSADSSAEFWATLENSGAVIQKSEKIFVKTDEQKLQPATSAQPRSYTIKTEPRLASLIEHLRNEGVNGKSIYIDNLVIIRGEVSKDMMRAHPYHIVQIPHLDMEIAICDQIGETTFVKKGTMGPVFWDSLTKDQLKARKEVNPLAQEKLDLKKIKASLLAHRLATGEWLKQETRGSDGKKGSYVLEHGPYAGKLRVCVLRAALSKGARGLPGGSSIGRLNDELKRELEQSPAPPTPEYSI